jgi:uncharacterized protein YndB with AHSA1/START domain
MKTAENTIITVAATINAPVEKVWKFWTEPRHITQWNQASADWHTPRAENDLRVDGKFLSRMEARDGSWGFDFGGTYNTVDAQQQIAYTLDDGRKVQISFSADGDKTTVTEIFEAEQTHPVEMQQEGWQAILNNFKNYVEAAAILEPMQFEISIHAKAEKVYRTMLDEKQYAAWTVAFNPASHYKGSWEKNARIVFLGEDKNGKTAGMVSRIKENIPNKFVSIEHLGMIENGQEIFSGPAVANWAGALENYTFTEDRGKTLLTVTLEASQEHKPYFSETWPKALEKLKAICEALP